jgi:hypothetical protein
MANCVDAAMNHVKTVPCEPVLDRARAHSEFE